MVANHSAQLSQETVAISASLVHNLLTFYPLNNLSNLLPIMISKRAGALGTRTTPSGNKTQLGSWTMAKFIVTGRSKCDQVCDVCGQFQSIIRQIKEPTHRITILSFGLYSITNLPLQGPQYFPLTSKPQLCILIFLMTCPQVCWDQVLINGGLWYE